jgi:hypothetical protein
MIKHKIKLQLENAFETALIINHYSSLTFIRKNGFKKTYTDHDIFMCLGQIRQDFPDIKFLCKGAKVNVFPSRMCSQMSNGAVAYEMTIGDQATRKEIVHIFDFEDKNLARDISEQIAFYREWLSSFGISPVDRERFFT